MQPSGPSGKDVVVWLVEDSSDYRAAIRDLVDDTDGMRCAQAFSSAERLLEHLDAELAPDVILMDIGLPGMNGVECVRRVRSRNMGTRLVMLTVHSEPDMIFDAICAGANGYLLKGGDNKEILEAIDDVAHARPPINGPIARRIREMFASRFRSDCDYALSAQETRILDLLDQGCSKLDIAVRLRCGRSTVDTYILSIYAKLQANTARETIETWLRERLG